MADGGTRHRHDSRRKFCAKFFCLFVCLFNFVHFHNMAAYTLPEGFTEFDMFTFGTALLVGGKLEPNEPEDTAAVRIKGTVHLV